MKADHLFELLNKPISEDENAELFIPNLKTYRVVGWTLAAFGMSSLIIRFFVKDTPNVSVIAGIMFLAIFGIVQWLTSPKYSPISLIRKQYSAISTMGPDVVEDDNVTR